MRRTKPIAVALLLLLASCDQASIVKKMTPPEDEQIARSYINLLRQNKFEQIQKNVDPSVKSADVKKALLKMAALMPPQEPKSVKVVHVNVVHSSDTYRSDISLEYEFPNEWLLINVVIQKKNGVSTLLAFNVDRLRDSLENLNKFTLAGKSQLQYAVLALAILIPLFSLYVLILCVRTRIEKRKWLWVVFIVLGIGQFTINWTTGQWRITPVAVELFGAVGFASPYGPWMISISIPLGAIVFLLRRGKFDRTSSQQIQ